MKQELAVIPNRKSNVRKLLSNLVLWIGIALIALLAMPAGIFFCGIFGVWSLVDRILKWIEK